MSSSEPQQGWSLTDRLLVLVATRLGGGLDQVDVSSNEEGLRVRDLVLELTGPKGPSPAEIRGALMDLIDCEYLSASATAGAELLGPHGDVRLRLRGLLAARRLQPGCGRSVGIVTLRMKRGRKAGVFDAQFDTGDAERDKMLNGAGLNLAAFYVLAVKQPTKAEPLLLKDCRWPFARLAHLGVGVRSGPGDRLLPSLESIGKALDRMRCITSLCSVSGEDARESGWFLREGFPEVRIVGATGGQLRDWTWMHFNLGQTLQGKPFPPYHDGTDRESVRPLTDAQLIALEGRESVETDDKPGRDGARATGDGAAAG